MVLWLLLKMLGKKFLLAVCCLQRSSPWEAAQAPGRLPMLQQGPCTPTHTDSSEWTQWVKTNNMNT